MRNMARFTGENSSGGEGGIRTPGTSFGSYNGLANRRLQPLGHLSGVLFYQFIIKLQIFTGHSRGKAFRFQVY